MFELLKFNISFNLFITNFIYFTSIIEGVPPPIYIVVILLSFNMSFCDSISKSNAFIYLSWYNNLSAYDTKSQ